MGMRKWILMSLLALMMVGVGRAETTFVSRVDTVYMADTLSDHARLEIALKMLDSQQAYFTNVLGAMAAFIALLILAAGYLNFWVYRDKVFAKVDSMINTAVRQRYTR